MNSMFRGAGLLVLCGLVLTTTGTMAPAFGGGGGGGGLSTVTVPLSMNGAGNIGPRGSAVLTFDATQTNRAVTVQLSNVHLPNGTLLNVVFTDNGLTDVVIIDGEPVLEWVPQDVGTLVVVNGTASGSISTANGQQVPIFGGNGEITINTIDGQGNILALYMSGVYVLGNGRP